MLLRRLLGAILDRMSRGRGPPIEVTATGFHVRCSDRVVPVTWPKVRRVSAYKVDHGTTDEIVVRFECDGPVPVVPVSEEWPGFQDLLAALAGELDIGPEWYVDIMTPVFAPTPRALYERTGEWTRPGRPVTSPACPTG